MKFIKCPRCNKGILKKGMASYSEFGVHFGRYLADICTYCKEAWFDEDVAQKLEDKSKKLGLFGLSKKIRVDYSNGILKLRFPKKFAKNFLEKSSSIVVQPNRRLGISLRILTKK